jgi:hypothetical protein
MRENYEGPSVRLNSGCIVILPKRVKGIGKKVAPQATRFALQELELL